MYDLDALTGFAAVMRHNSLSGSARELGLPKSTLSRRLQRLEAQLGQPLLRRDANRMLPTEAGRVFERYCLRILELADESRVSLDELREEISGELVLHVHEAFARGWFAHHVERFLAAHPGIRISLRTQTDAPDPRARDIICLWLGSLPTDTGVRQEVLGHLTRGIHAHPDYLRRCGAPAHPRELAQHSWVDLLGETDQGVTLHHRTEGRFVLNPFPSRMQVDRLVLHSDAIAQGHGLGLLPHWVAAVRTRHHPNTLASCLTEWQAPALPVTLLYPHGHLPRRTRAFLEHLRAGVPDAWRISSERELADWAGSGAGRRREQAGEVGLGSVGGECHT